MKELKVDLGALELAFSSDNEFMSAYFDAETGKTHFLEAGLLSRIDEEDPDEPVEAMASGPNEDDLSLARQIVDSWGTRFHPVPCQDSREGYRDMERFIATVKNEHLRDLLEVAINGRGVFRRFKDVLLNYPDERQRWFDFQSDRERRRIVAWLESIGISPIDPIHTPSVHL
jgi:hypothetical protein